MERNVISITLKDRETNTEVWRLEGPFSMDFAMGVVAAVEHVTYIRQPPFDDYTVLITRQRPLGTLTTEFQAPINIITLEDEEIREIFRGEEPKKYIDALIKYGELADRPGKYYYWLQGFREYLIREYRATPEFLQALFTVLDLFGIPRTEVLIFKPFKNGVFYDVQGLDLPMLQ